MKRNTEHILDEWLVINIQLGDRQALDLLAKRWYSKLLRYSTRQLGNAEQARDVVQQTFEVLLKDIAKLREPEAFPAWIYRVLHHRGVDAIRRKQVQREHTQVLAQLDNVSHNTDEDCDTLFGDLHFERLLAALSANQYMLVHLYYLEGFHMAEIANMLCVPEGTVKSRLHKARQFLKHYLEGENNG